MKPININKTLNFTDGSIELKYNGVMANDDVDLNKIETLLEDFINNHRHDDMIENVRIVRTILKDCDENLLTIFYSDKEGLELVKYDKSDLVLYKKCEREDEVLNKYEIMYELHGGIKLNYNNQEIDATNYSDIELVSKEISKIMEHIYYLKHTGAVSLNKYDKLLIEIYKLFYDENPDFSSEDINIKVQMMMTILGVFGIYLGDYTFDLCGKSNIPLSLNLEQRVCDLYPLGKVDSDKVGIKLAKEPKQIVKAIGETIRDEIKNEQDPNKALLTISKVIFVEKSSYFLYGYGDVKKISEFTGYTTDEVQSSMELVKRIQTKIDKQTD